MQGHYGHEGGTTVTTVGRIRCALSASFVRFVTYTLTAADKMKKRLVGGGLTSKESYLAAK